MDRSEHDLSGLFAQLGLANDTTSIDAFITRHSPIAPRLELHLAAFWTPAQAALLHEAIGEDADWAAIVDALNLQLRGQSR